MIRLISYDKSGNVRQDTGALSDIVKSLLKDPSIVRQNVQRVAKSNQEARSLSV